MYCAACHARAQPVTISEVAEKQRHPRSHLTKIVQQLAALGLLDTTAGVYGGGMRLMRPAEQINLARWCAPPKAISSWSNVSTPSSTPAA